MKLLLIFIVSYNVSYFNQILVYTSMNQLSPPIFGSYKSNWTFRILAKHISFKTLLYLSRIFCTKTHPPVCCCLTNNQLSTYSTVKILSINYFPFTIPDMKYYYLEATFATDNVLHHSYTLEQFIRRYFQVDLDVLQNFQSLTKLEISHTRPSEYSFKMTNYHD